MMDLMPEIEDHIRHNCRMKIYPDGSREVMVSQRAIFLEAGWEEVSDKLDFNAERFEYEPLEDVERSIFALARREAAEVKRAALNLERAKRRARAAVSDLALSNDFRYFVTLTLDGSKVNRYDVKEITSKLNAWCDNHVRRKGLKYVLVAERHKDGAVHFHGFFNDVLPVSDSGTIAPAGGGKPRRPRSCREREALLAAGGHVVYNLPSWTLGFTTAIELYGTRRAAVGYVTKYITKAAEKVGGRWYYSGGELRRPAVEYADVDFDSFSTLENVGRFTVEALGCDVVKFTVESDNIEKSV